MLNDEIKQRFLAWWNGSETDRPLIRISGLKEKFDCKKFVNEKAYLI